MNISDVYWVEDNVARITKSAASSFSSTGGNTSTSSASEGSSGDKSERIFESQHYCLNVNIKRKGQKNFKPLHSYDSSADFYDAKLTDSEKKERLKQLNKDRQEKRNPFNPESDNENNGSLADQVESTKKQPCLIGFNLWQERDVDYLNSPTVNPYQALREELLETDMRQECEIDQLGIYMNNTCHYYQVLKRLCLKLRIEKDENDVEKVFYDSGCFTNNEAALMEDVTVGTYFNFAKEVAVEVRSAEDPYMVFAYTKYNLGTDFTIFFYLASVIASISAIALLVVLFLYVCRLQNKPRHKKSGAVYLDSEMADMRNLPSPQHTGNH